jgi:dephospho-CoA kinase
MLNLKKIAVTGGLASGKSSVCQILKACGAYVISADEIVHRLLDPETSIGQQVIDLLGPEILENQKIDRKKIAQKVFSNPELLECLEKLLHPIVLDEIKNSYQKISERQDYTLFVAEIPLLYESESHTFFDAVLTVISDEAISKKRFTNSTKHPPSEYDARMKRQLPLKHKAAIADYLIENNGTLEDLKKQVINLYQSYLK